MHIAMLARRVAVVAILAAVGVLMVAVQGAGAAQVPPQDFTCGDPSLPLTPCNQTAHFSDTFRSARRLRTHRPARPS
jgi:hypothetical protein